MARPSRHPNPGTRRATTTRIKRGKRVPPSGPPSRAHSRRGKRKLRIAALVSIPLLLGVALVALQPGAVLPDNGPSISRLSSTYAPVQGGTELIITGKGFSESPIVTFGDLPGEVRFATSKKIVVKVPPRDEGAVTVNVRTIEGSSKSGRSSRFYYVGPPKLSKVSPGSGKAKGGHRVTIKGTGYVDGTTVRFGETPATDVLVTSPTSLSVEVPEQSFGPVDVHVTTPYGTSPVSGDSEYVVGSKSELRLNVGSFNVRVASGYRKFRESRLERPWSVRLPVVARQIKDEDLDIVGIQEASASAKYTVSGRTQYYDIVNALGKPYKLTNGERYCAGSGAGATCRNGGSSSDRIIYNSERLKLLGQGARKLDSRSSRAGSTRNVIWAKFKDRRSGKTFFAASTHLEPGKVNGLRVRQARIILDTLADANPKKLPTILVGDFGAGKLDSQGNGAHTVLTQAGFVDPLVNSRRYRGTDTRVKKAVNVRISSLNYFRAAPQVLGGFPIGSYLDYILVRGGDFDLHRWKTVVDLNTAGRFTGVIPSDHNLVTLTLGLP